MVCVLVNVLFSLVKRFDVPILHFKDWYQFHLCYANVPEMTSEEYNLHFSAAYSFSSHPLYLASVQELSLTQTLRILIPRSICSSATSFSNSSDSSTPSVTSLDRAVGAATGVSRHITSGVYNSSYLHGCTLCTTEGLCDRSVA